MAETGFRLVIPQEMIDRLAVADEKIEKIAKTSEDAQKRIDASFKAMAQGGIDEFIKKLNQAQQVLSAIKDVNAGNINLNSIATQASQGADAINRLIETVVKLTQENNNLKNSFGSLTDKQLGRIGDRASNLNYREELNAIREKTNAERERERELIQQDKRNQRRHAETMAQLKAEIKEINNFARAYAQIPRNLSTKDVGKLIARSMQSDKTINQNISAIKNLEKAKKDLDTTDVRYKQTLAKLDAEINRHKEILRKLGVNVDNVKNSHKGLMNISEQLTRRLALVFSVSQITGYVNKLVKVRGEFELQQRSLQAILQNKDEADKLWQQTIVLAVRSPFRVAELVKYTKQLAAYRVETEKLHDTTKMLSDVSAGLGVDMQRLILAFGQVKAANYLRGTELRQFSEAGINILGELATYFTELEGRAVSVGDVFERVSKRMVAFSDVEEIFKRLTSEGGTFYRMQEIQSNTLKGMLSNLQDSIDLMLNDIGKSNEGTLKNMVSLMKTLVDNWRAFAVVLKQASLVMAGMGITKFVSGWSMVAKEAAAAAMAMNGMAGAGARLNVALKAIGTTIKTHPILLLVGVLVSTGHALWEYTNAINESNKRYDEMSDRAYRSREQLSKLQSQIEQNNDSISDANKILSKGATQSNEYTKAKEKLNSAEKTSEILYSQLKAQYPDILSYITKQKDGTINLANAVDLYNKKVSIQIALNEQAKGGFGYESVEGNYEDLLNRQSKINSLVTQVKSTTESAITQLDRFKDVLPDDVFNQIMQLSNKVLTANKDNIIGVRAELMKYLQLVKGVSPDMQEIIGLFSGDVFNFDVYTLSKQLGNYKGDWEDFAENLQRMLPSFQAAKRALSFDNAEDQKQAGVFFNSLLNSLGIVDEEIRKTTQQWIELKLALQGKIDWSGFPTSSTNTPQTTTSDEDEKASKILSDRITLIKDLNKAYEELNDTFDDADAKQRVISSYMNTFNPLFKELGITIEDIKFDSINGVLDALRQLLPTVKQGTEDWIKLQKAISDTSTSLDVKDRQTSDKALLDQIEEMFSGYEVSLELQKLNIPKDWAKEFFGIDTFDLGDIRKKIEQQLATGNYGEKTREELEKDLKKVEEMEVKAQQERLKKYLQYARDAVGERAKIKLEEMRKLQEIEDTFTSPEQVEVKQKAIAKVRKDSEQEQQKLDWEEFQKSDTFVSLFSDLDNASSALINHSLKKLREFKEQWKDMPLEDMKSIVGKINELEIALAAIEPFKGIKELKDSIKKAAEDTRWGSKDAQSLASKGDYANAFDLERAFQQERYNAAQQEISDIETILNYKEQGQNLDEISLNLSRNQQLLSALSVDTLKSMLQIQQGIAQNASQNVVNSSNILSNNIELQKKYNEQANAIQQVQKMANDLYDAFKGLSEALGGGDSVGAIFADMGMQMLNTVLNTLMLQVQLQAASVSATAFGAAMNAAMGIIGWIVMAVQLISQVLGAIFAAHDKRLEKQIENLKEQVDELNKKLDILQEKLDEAFNVRQLQQYTKEIQRNINAQIKAYEQMIKLEEDKKKTDKDKIKDYKESIEELKKTQKELQEEAVSTATSGILDSVKDAARDFVDAWYDAFQETGNGLQGLKDNFKEVMLDMVQQQATLAIASNFLDRWKSQLDKYINKDDLELTAQEAGNWVKTVQSELPMLNEALEQYFKAMEDAGVDLGGTMGELSGLQRGISGITETQADVIASYLNSLRFFVSDSNLKLTQLVSSFTNSETPNPILSELRSQSEMIRAIRDMFSSVIGRGSTTHSGAYLKVAL